MAMKVTIEAALPEHFEVLREIESQAHKTLRIAGAATGDAEASDDAAFRRYLDAGLLLVAIDENGEPVGFAGGYVVNGWLHLAEADVHPRCQRLGIGRRLIEGLLLLGRERQLVGATLTTDRHASFNAPFYASTGFRIVEGDECPSRVSEILASEKERGFDPARRVAMLLEF
jgi:GNAT superfamily N-acetyltransferase